MIGEENNKTSQGKEMQAVRFSSSEIFERLGNLQEYLRDLLQRDDTNLLVKLVLKQPEILRPTKFGRTLVHLMCEANSYNCLRFALSKYDLSCETLTLSGQSPLHVACERGSLECAKVLVVCGANPDLQDLNGMTPIMLATKFGHQELALFLIEKSTNLNVTQRNKWSALHFAVSVGDFEVAKNLVNYGADINAQTKEEWTPLHIAIANRYINLTEYFVNQDKCNLEAKNKSGCSALLLACNKGEYHQAELLLRAGADPEVLDKDRWHSFHHAVSSGSIDLVRLLYERGMDVNQICDDGTALNIAVVDQNFTMVEFLLSLDSKIHLLPVQNTSPLHSAVAREDEKIATYLIDRVLSLECHEVIFDFKDSENKTVVDLLILFQRHKTLRFLVESLIRRSELEYLTSIDFLKSCIELGARNIVFDLHRLGLFDNLVLETNSYQLLQISTMKGDFELVKLWLECGIDSGSLNDKGLSLLHLAALGGYSDLVEFYLNLGFPPSHLSFENYQVAEYACIAGSLECVRIIFQHESFSDYIELLDFFELVHICARFDCPHILEFLMQYELDLNAKDRNKRTALWYAVENQNIECLTLLLEMGADPSDSGLLTDVPMQKAVEYGNLEILKLLFKFGADVAIEDYEDYSFIMTALESYDHEIFRLLLERGADPHYISEARQSPIHLACYLGNLLAVEQLILAGVNCDLQDQMGFTPIMLAVLEGHISIVALLIKNQVNLSLSDVDGCTVADYALLSGSSNLRYLIEGSSAPNSKITRIKNEEPVRSIIGATASNIAQNAKIEFLKNWILRLSEVPPLLKAIRDADLRGFERLVQDRSHREEVDAQGLAPLHYAVIFKQFYMAEVLIERGANIDVIENEGYTPIMLAVENGDTVATQLLLKAHPSVIQRSIRGETVVSIASKLQNEEIVDMLYKLLNTEEELLMIFEIIAEAIDI